MMGSRHALSGAALCLGGGILALPALAGVALFSTLGAGFSVLPDIDHPDSGVAKCLGPISRGMAWGVSRMSGGHRNGTHSFAGAAAFTMLGFEISAVYEADTRPLLIGMAIAAVELAMGWAIGHHYNRGRRRRQRAYRERWHAWASAGALMAVYAVVAVAELLWGQAAGAWMLGGLITLSLAALLRAWLPLKKWLNNISRVGRSGVLDEAAPFLVAVGLVTQGVDLSLVPYSLAAGVVIHIAGDAPTIQGCPLGWPWSQKQLGLLPKRFRFVTNGPVEVVIGWVLAVAIAALMILHLGVWAPDGQIQAFESAKYMLSLG